MFTSSWSPYERIVWVISLKTFLYEVLKSRITGLASMSKGSYRYVSSILCKIFWRWLQPIRLKVMLHRHIKMIFTETSIHTCVASTTIIMNKTTNKATMPKLRLALKSPESGLKFFLVQSHARWYHSTFSPLCDWLRGTFVGNSGMSKLTSLAFVVPSLFRWIFEDYFLLKY